MNEDAVNCIDVLRLIEFIKPWQMANDIKVRIGRESDGGYVMPSLSRKSNCVLSIGIGDEVSFDDSLADQGAMIYQFDHTISVSPSLSPKVKFFRRGWGVADSGEYLSLKSMISLVDWSNVSSPILKFDAEGVEWMCLAHADREDLAKFDVLVGEFHGLNEIENRASFNAALQVFTKISETHRCIHLHGNNTAGFSVIAGIPFPRVIELTYVRNEVAAFFGFSNEPIPGPLDFPNDRGRPDLFLRAF